LSILFDASAAINLANGDAFRLVFLLPKVKFTIGPQAAGECSKTLAVVEAIAKGQITVLSDVGLSGRRFLELISQFNLGAGETECIVFAEGGDYIIACDDLRARKILQREFATIRLTGSLGLLRSCVSEGILTAQEAFEIVELMRVRGGFLPEVNIEFFS
jgi:predicted nucleic acid-binding protein